MTPLQLQAQFRYMFEPPHADYTFHRGWFANFVHLCEAIDLLLGTNKGGFHWTQVKEKWGAARFYWAMSGAAPMHFDLMHAKGVDMFALPPERDGDLAVQIHALVQEAAAATRLLCIYCGEPGVLDTKQPWVLVVCPTHKKQRAGRQRQLRAWLEPDEDVPI